MFGITRSSANRGRGTTAKGITLLYAQILPVMAIVCLFPAIPKLFQHFGGIEHAAIFIPMIVTIPSLFLAIFAPVAGIVSDRYGRRVCFTAGMAVYSIAGLVPVLVDRLDMIVASRAVLGIAEAFIITVSSTLIADYFGERRHGWVSWVGISTSIAGTLLIIAGGALADISWKGPFFIYLLAIPGFIMTLIFIDEPLKSNTESSGTIQPLGFPFKIAFLIGGVTFVASIVYYVEPLNIANILSAAGIESFSTIGVIQALTTLPYILGAMLYRWLFRWSIGNLLALAGLFIAIGQIVIGFAPHYIYVSVGACIQQLGAGMVIPALLAWGQSILPFEQRSRGMGIWATAFFTGTFVCPMLVNMVEQAHDLQKAMVVFGFIAMALALLSFFFAQSQKMNAVNNKSHAAQKGQ
ncbi:Tetracycline resistance protein, class B [Marinomonas spartinae]|uniref:MFS transporter n=1 Tax=Marinomonas spartinae TaxID=1792290 RepID=UPI000808FDA9|nr:MFS transporter [Marinomonas spartinae]SBS29508.1 Tetracycline resistance protein, class B [Marinomonas spartinae]